jgi:hypothetical protein
MHVAREDSLGRNFPRRFFFLANTHDPIMILPLRNAASFLGQYPPSECKLHKTTESYSFASGILPFIKRSGQGGFENSCERPLKKAMLALHLIQTLNPRVEPNKQSLIPHFLDKLPKLALFGEHAEPRLPVPK